MWKPIETAPKDETEILLVLDEVRRGVRWKHAMFMKAFWSKQYQDWYELECDSNSLEEKGYIPVLWTELPALTDEKPSVDETAMWDYRTNF